MEKQEIKEKLIHQLTDLLDSEEGVGGLKKALIDSSNYSIAATLRELELATTSTRKKYKKEHDKAKQLEVALRLVDIRCSERQAFLMHSIAEKFIEIGGEFSMRDSAKIVANTAKIFD